MNKAVFLDRDGLLNRKALPHDYIKCWAEFTFLPDVPEAIRRLNDAGYLVLIVTNQRGVARGLMTMEAVEDIHWRMREALARYGARVDGIYVCPHGEKGCDCRKPGIGLFLQAEREYPIDKASSWMIGDSESDVMAGRRYGVRSLLTDDLPGAVAFILSQEQRRFGT